MTAKKEFTTTLNIRILIGIILVVGGILAVVYGGFSYTGESDTADLGPVELSVDEEKTVNIPLWFFSGQVKETLRE
ncbi:MAG: hypothetical protein V2I67_18660 [Thermoanaerobaculales bacterium]|nr:hypothetical protein [Thermoanaerobaculales bacterium]